MDFDYSDKFSTPKPGEIAVRKCECYWETCDGCCNSCTKNQFTTSNKTTFIPNLNGSTSSSTITGDSTYPKPYYTDGVVS